MDEFERQEEESYQDDITMKEYKAITNLIIPTALTSFFKQSLHMFSLIFIGQVQSDNPAVMAGAGLGHAFKVLFGVSVLNGINGGLDTFANQAVGAGHISLAGRYLNRARVINAITFIPCFLILWNT